MHAMDLHLFVIVFLAGQLALCRGDDATTPGTSGAAVVNDVIKRIQDTGIFPDDNCFLMRIAQVESRCGEDKNTYRKGYHGGIWQVWFYLTIVIYRLSV